MNTIIVPISKITEYMRKQKELGKDNFKEVYGLDFIFEKFKLILTDDDGFKRTWIVELHDKCKEGYAETKGSDLIIHWVGDNVEIAVPAFSQFFNDDEKLIEQRGSITKTLILGIIWYIMTANRKRIVKEKEACAKREKSKEKERRDYDKKVFLLDEIVEYISKKESESPTHNTRTIDCPCWSVRGHYRHYKSGKVVFIKGHKKGKDRENAQPKDKTYTV